jgi:hypothetical protein
VKRAAVRREAEEGWRELARLANDFTRRSKLNPEIFSIIGGAPPAFRKKVEQQNVSKDDICSMKSAFEAVRTIAN